MTLHYSTPLEFKASDAGIVDGYLARFHTEDLGGDICLPGCFAKTLGETKARGTPIPLLWNHDAGIVLGKFAEMAEDSTGLRVRGHLTLATAAAREKYALLKDRAVTGLSIGYSIPQGGSERRGDVRLLKEIELHEGSLVAVPMHPDARVTAVKSALACASPRELEQLLRDTIFLSSRKAKAAANAIWPILNEREAQEDDRDDHQAEPAQLKALAAQLQSITSLLSPRSHQ